MYVIVGVIGLHLPALSLSSARLVPNASAELTTIDGLCRAAVCVRSERKTRAGPQCASPDAHRAVS